MYTLHSIPLPARRRHPALPISSIITVIIIISSSSSSSSSSGSIRIIMIINARQAETQRVAHEHPRGQHARCREQLRPRGRPAHTTNSSLLLSVLLV